MAERSRFASLGLRRRRSHLDRDWVDGASRSRPVVAPIS